MNRDINMGTENRTNEMNMDMTGRRPRAKKMRRRILALTCALAIALLQCAVIMTVGTEEVSAAGNITIRAEYTNGVKASLNVSKATLNGYPKVSKDVVDGDQTVSVSGPTIKTILEKNGINSDSIKSITVYSDGGAMSDILVMSIGDQEVSEYKIHNGGESIEDLKDANSTFEVVRTNEPIEFASKPSPDKDNPKKGEKVTISYNLKVDEFYSKTDLYSNNDTKLTWSSNGPIKLNKTETSGTGKLTLTGDVTGDGSITITPNSTKFNASSGVVQITGKTDAPTQKKKISAAKITLSKYSYTYDGKEKKPSVTVKMGDKKLKQGTDYTVSYSNNKSVGTATVTIKGKGKYEGSVTQTFTISKSSNNNNNNNNTRNTSKYRTFATRSPGASTATTRTGTTTVPTVTYTPDRTITVKEVYLGQEIQEEQQQNPYEEMYEDPYSTDESGTTNEWEDMDTSVDFGPAASSAAAAAAVCGAGAIGRIRRFRVDTKSVVSAASQAGNQTTAQAGPETEKKSRLSRFKKS